MLKSVFLSILFSSFFVQAEYASTLTAFTESELKNIKFTCEQKSKLNCDNKYLKLIKVQSDLCKIDFQKNKCDEKIKKNSEMSWRYKRCDEASLCYQNQIDVSDRFEACFLGLLELPRMLGQAAVDLASATPGALEAYFKRLGQRLDDRSAMLKQCNKSIECKRQLARGNPTTLHLADPKHEKDLAKYTAVYLWSKNKEYEPRRVQLMIHGGMTKEQYYKEIGLTPKEYSQVKNLSVEDGINLLAMWETVKKFVEDEYQDVMCFSPLEKTRLSCSVFADVLSGVGIEKALAQRTAKLAQSGSQLVERKVAETLSKRLAETSLNKFEIVKLYAQKNSTSTFENQEWLNFINAQRPTLKNVTIENSALKTMNDKIFKDEEFVTALTNMYKEIQLDKFKTLELEIQKKYPQFKFQYFSDYKGVRVAYDEIPGLKLDADIQKLITSSNTEYSQMLLDKGIVRSSDNPAGWFKGSLAKSDDWANLAARYARSNESSMFVNASDNPQFEKWVQKEFEAGQQLRSEIVQSFKGTSVLIEESGVQNLHRDAIEILRKNKDNPAEAKALIEQKFGLQKLSDQNFNNLSGYFEKVDQFSPGLRGVKRDFATLADSTHGGISIDMIGLGADHIQQTSAKAFGTAKNMDEFLAIARKGEESLTGDVLQRKRVIENHFKKITGDPEAVVMCSGDGCKAYLKNREVTSSEGQKLSDVLTSAGGESGRLRFSQVSKLEKQADADFIAKKGEDIEKAIRRSAVAEIDLRRLEGINFTVQIAAKDASGGAAKVHISTANGVVLSRGEKKRLESLINTAIKDSGYQPK